jgi:HAD superfamily hydrolase (TIGR01509 family)
MRRFRALIFDVDGTLAETEELHRRAFNETFAHFGLGWEWSVALYGELLRTTGGKERIRRFWRLAQAHDPGISDDEVTKLHRFKTMRYIELMRMGACPLRPGIADAIRAARSRGQRLAIATTTSRENVEVLLSTTLGAGGSGIFDQIVAGDEVNQKKPTPDAYLKVLSLLGLPGSDCLAIEDSRNGLVAASRAGIPVLITRSAYFKTEDFDGAAAVVDRLDELRNFELPVASG